MLSIRAHFDGKVFVPEEPVNLPPQVSVRLLVATEPNPERSLLDLAEAAVRFPDDPASPAEDAAEHDNTLDGTRRAHALRKWMDENRY